MSIYLGNTSIGNGNYLGNLNIPDSNIFIVPPTYAIDWLLVGGGASGGTEGSQTGGSGGAGRFVSSSISIIGNPSSMAIVIGAGGAGVTWNGLGTGGNDGGQSTITILGTTYTAPGGGGGAQGLTTTPARNGRAGGSGGGGAATSIFNTSSGGSNVAGSPIEGFGNNGEGMGSSSAPTSGVGGGAGGTPTGLAWLNGITYCVGGGGSGGDAGSGTAGQASPNNSATAASGICIIRYPSSLPTLTGGTITTSGGYTYHTFTTDGTFN